MMNEQERIENLFSNFIGKHCEVSDKAWVQSDILHTAFMDHCIIETNDIRWVDKHVIYEILSTESMCMRFFNCKLKGTRRVRILAGVMLVTYP